MKVLAPQLTMTKLEIFLSVTTTLFALVAGWLKVTEKTRVEVFSQKLSIYKELNQLAIDHFHLKARIKIKTPTKELNVTELDVANSYLKFINYLCSNSLFISDDIYKIAESFINPRTSDFDHMRNKLKSLSDKMSQELKLNNIHKTNNFLFTFLKEKQKHFNKETKDKNNN